MKYFNISEFDSPDVIGSGEKMNKEFLNRLDLARELADTPFKITSGVRSDAHNKKGWGSFQFISYFRLCGRCSL